jgi:hypothetical protein
MSKKLIAVAAAAALALTGLVGIAPANANAAAITYTDNTGTSTAGTTAATAFKVHVPQTNALVSASGSTGTALTIAVTNLVVGDKVTVSVTGPAKVTEALHAASSLVNVTTLGAASVTKTVASGNSASLYVYTTSTTVVSTITISIEETDGTTKSTTNAVRYIEGESNSTSNSDTNAYKVANLTAPSNLASGVEGEVSFNVHDAFGNVLEGPANIAGALTASTGTTNGIATWDAVRELHVAKVTSTTNNPFVLTVDVNGTEDAPTNLGLGASATTSALIVNNTTVNSQVAALTAQIATMRPKATSVTKKKYNTLARKWNAAFPSQKVKLKK